MGADPLAADPEEAAALVGRGDALDDLEHELAVGGDLVGVGLRRQRPLRVAEPRDGLRLELLLAPELVRRDRGHRGDDLVDERRSGRFLPRLGIGLADRHRLTQGAALLADDHVHRRDRRRARDEPPLLGVELGLLGHSLLLSLSVVCSEVGRGQMRPLLPEQPLPQVAAEAAQLRAVEPARLPRRRDELTAADVAETPAGGDPAGEIGEPRAADDLPQPLEHRAGSVVDGEAAEEVRGVAVERRRREAPGLPVGAVHLAEEAPRGQIAAFDPVVEQHLEVGRPALAVPDHVPLPGRNAVAHPLVGELVGEHGRPRRRPVLVAGEVRLGLVLEHVADARHPVGDQAGGLEWVGAEAPGEEVDDLGNPSGRGSYRRLALHRPGAVDRGEDRDRGAAGAVGHRRGRDVEEADGAGGQIRGHRPLLGPCRRRGAVAVVDPRDPAAGADRRVGARGGRAEQERRLVGGMVVAREPALGADRLVDDEGAVAGLRPV